jgi:hypothetical protein
VVLYDNYHCGRHLDMIFQYTHTSSQYIKGDTLVSCAWASGAEPRDVYLLIGTNKGGAPVTLRPCCGCSCDCHFAFSAGNGQKFWCWTWLVLGFPAFFVDTRMP